MRITTQETSGRILLLIEGRLTGPRVDELERWFAQKKSESAGRPVVLDLNEVTKVDAQGRSLLAQIQQAGGILVNANPLAQYLLSHGPSDSPKARVRGRSESPVVLDRTFRAVR